MERLIEHYLDTLKKERQASKEREGVINQVAEFLDAMKDGQIKEILPGFTSQKIEDDLYYIDGRKGGFSLVMLLDEIEAFTFGRSSVYQ